MLVSGDNESGNLSPVQNGAEIRTKPYAGSNLAADGGNPEENPEVLASSEPEKKPEKARKPKTRKQPIEAWLFIWGEVEQQRRICGDVAKIQISTDAAGKSRGGYSLPSSLLIHASIDGNLRAMGSWAYELVAKAYVDGWQWEEAFTEGETFTDSFGRVTRSLPRATGRYYRKAIPGALRHHQVRTVRDIIRDLARVMGFAWREEKNEEKEAA